MIIKNGLVWEESGSFRKKELVVDTTTHRIAETAEDDTVFDDEALRGAGNSKKRENQAGGA